jgi:hypothetical protein
LNPLGIGIQPSSSSYQHPSSHPLLIIPHFTDASVLTTLPLPQIGQSIPVEQLPQNVTAAWHLAPDKV